MNLRFENDVKMYGIQTDIEELPQYTVFENDVKMYGIQTKFNRDHVQSCLRMM